MPVREVPLWLDGSRGPGAGTNDGEACPPLRGTAACEVAVIGGGMTGASAARALAERGMDTALLEKGALAGSASGRNAGFVVANLAEPYAEFAAKAGRDRAREVWGVQQANRERVAALVAELRLDCGFARTGSWQCADGAHEAEALRRSAAMLRADGFAARFLEPDEATRLLGPAAQHGALHREGDARIHPARFTWGLAAAAAQAGARLHEGTHVTRLAPAPGGGGWVVEGPGFALRAGHVVIAANALAPALHPWLAARIQPVRGQMLAFAPDPALEAVVPGPVYARRGYEYWRLHEGALVLGGSRPVARGAEATAEEQVNPRVQEALEAWARASFPGTPLRVTHRWAGVMAFTPDGFPLVGRVPGAEPGLWCAAGFTGHGFGYATLAAEAVAEAIATGRPGETRIPPCLATTREVDPGLRPPA